jgi:response regulator RpfG family c-di-GMP phosphodiesterase
LNLEPRSVLGKISRLFRALSPAQARPDDDWANSKLPASELEIYKRMDPRDREHAIRVAQKLLELHPEASSEVIRAALLHDCGKLVRPYNVFERVMVGLIAPEGPRSSQTSNSLQARTAMDVRNNHPQIGAKLILEAGGDSRVAELVQIHHQPKDDPEANWIHQIDDLE